MTSYPIPVYQPDPTSHGKRYVLAGLDSTLIFAKDHSIAQFKHGWANFMGAKLAAGVCCGTVASHLTLVTLGIGPGDEVIVPPGSGLPV